MVVLKGQSAPARPKRRLAGEIHSVSAHEPEPWLRVIVRAPQVHDSAAIASLLDELGYPTALLAVGPRLAGFGDEGLMRVVVAELDGAVVGLATGHAFHAIHVDQLTAYLTALVVAKSARRRGVGAALLAGVATWARSLGAPRLSVVTGLHRVESHLFYEQQGLERTGFRYSRPIL